MRALSTLTSPNALALAGQLITAAAQSYQQTLAHRQAIAELDLQRAQTEAQTRIMLAALEQHYQTQRHALEQYSATFNQLMAQLDQHLRLLHSRQSVVMQELAQLGQQPVGTDPQVFQMLTTLRLRLYDQLDSIGQQQSALMQAGQGHYGQLCGQFQQLQLQKPSLPQLDWEV